MGRGPTEFFKVFNTNMAAYIQTKQVQEHTGPFMKRKTEVMRTTSVDGKKFSPC